MTLRWDVAFYRTEFTTIQLFVLMVTTYSNYSRLLAVRSNVMSCIMVVENIDMVYMYLSLHHNSAMFFSRIGNNCV